MRATKFGKRLGKTTKRENTARVTKAAIRSRVLASIGADQAHVFDAYAGAGVAYYGVWKHAASYLGCDIKWYPDERLAYVADNRRVLRLIDLLHFNIFDFDAFGSPWEQAYIMSARRTLSPGERFGLVITDGSSLHLRFGAFPTALGLLANISHKASGLAKQQAKIIDSALDSVAARLGGSIVERWQARGKKGSSMRYIGLVLEGHKKSPDH